MTLLKLAFALAACAAACHAQDPVLKSLKGQVDMFRQNLIEAAEKAPVAVYDFRPSAEVMSFHEQLAHITDGNYSICSPLKNEANPKQGVAASKAAPGKDVIPALRASFEYCDSALGGLTDAKLGETIKRGTSERAAAYYALHLLDHVSLHYGNLITYMRLNGIVPPETERRQRPAAGKK